MKSIPAFTHFLNHSTQKTIHQKYILKKRISSGKSYYTIKTYNLLEYKPNFLYIIPTNPIKPANFAINKRIPKFLKNLSNPYHLFKDKKLKSYTILGIGGNQGNVLETFWKLFSKLNKHIIAHSYFLKNPAFGYTTQQDFYNGVIWLKTNLCLTNFFSYCMYLERIFKRKRKRAFKNAPRYLDIDILGFKNKTITLRHLCIPHKEWAKRESVMIPLKGLQ